MSEDRVGKGERDGRQEEEATTEAETELESLADEMATRIDASPAADREALHDYAVSLVRERLPVAADMGAAEQGSGDDEQTDIAKSGGAGGAGALGFGLLLFMVGLLLMPVFSPVGLMLLVASVALVLGGLATALLTKVRGGQKEEEA